MKSSFLQRLFPFDEPPNRSVRISLFLVSGLFLFLFVGIAVTSLIPNHWEERIETTIDYASMERINTSEFGGYVTAIIEAVDGRVYKIDSLLTKRLDLDALQLFLFRAGDVKLIVYRQQWILGISADDVVFMDEHRSMRIIDHNNRLNILVTMPLFLAVSLYFTTLATGRKRIRTLFAKRRKHI